jgi:hypothetical protein
VWRKQYRRHVYLRFELYENGNEVSSFDFNDGMLVTKFEHGVSEIIREDA